MDLLLLHAIVAEASSRLVQHELARIACLGTRRYLLRFTTPERDNLLISLRPDLPRVHLLTRGRRMREAPLDAFGASVDGELSGAMLVALRVFAWDRVVALEFRLPRRDDQAARRTLILEMLGRSCNLLLLDEEGRILGQARSPRGASRVPVAGRLYEPPRGRESLAGLPMGAAALPRLTEGRVERAAGAGGAMTLESISPLLSREHNLSAGPTVGATRARLADLLARVASGPFKPMIYSRRELDSLVDGDAIGPEDLIISPVPLLAPAAAGLTCATRFPSCSEAAEVGLDLIERLADFRDARESLRALAQRELQRLSRLRVKLHQDQGRAEEAERWRRSGEALLAGLVSAHVEGGTARVPDPYETDGAMIEIPIDPSLPLTENARRMFERYKKARRGEKLTAVRLRALEERARGWEDLAGQAAMAGDRSTLEALQAAMERLGLASARRPAMGKRAAARTLRAEPPARVRRLASADGLSILVGRSGEENDRLTFRVASPEDFWLHAAGQPGAHVVIRNPERLKTIPERTLKLAAEIAAYYSGSRGEAKAEVHYTQRKHVHKRKGMPKGQVLLRRFRSIQVTPRIPAATLDEM